MVDVNSSEASWKIKFSLDQLGFAQIMSGNVLFEQKGHEQTGQTKRISVKQIFSSFE